MFPRPTKPKVFDLESGAMVRGLATGRSEGSVKRIRLVKALGFDEVAFL